MMSEIHKKTSIIAIEGLTWYMGENLKSIGLTENNWMNELPESGMG